MYSIIHKLKVNFKEVLWYFFVYFFISGLSLLVLIVYNYEYFTSLWLVLSFLGVDWGNFAVNFFSVDNVGIEGISKNLINTEGSMAESKPEHSSAALTTASKPPVEEPDKVIKIPVCIIVHGVIIVIFVIS
jgi:hypothetical protein